MALTGPEPIIDAIVDRLTNNLSAYIDQVNSEVVDGIFVEPPTTVMARPPIRDEMTSFPVVAVVEGRFIMEDDTGSGGTGRMPVTIVSYVQSADPDVLATQLRRMDRAVVECVMEGRRILPLVWGVRFLHSDPGPTLGRQEGPREYMSLRASTIEVRFEQDTP